MTSIIGAAAGILTSLSNIPQAIKVVRTGRCDDLSVQMLFILVCGLGCWIAYGLARSDMPVVLANLTSGGLTAFLLVRKLVSARHATNPGRNKS